ncbi:MAG: hypothetical protein NVSMB47_17040 [Polyangiales bacterium]
MTDAGDLRPLLARAKSDGEWQPLVDAIPFARFLGLSVRVEGGEAICAMRFDPKLVGNYTIPALHGGTLGALLESAAVFALFHAREAAALPKIINVTIDYLRSARAVDTFATATITKQGRRVATVQAIAWQDDRARPVATANAHFLLPAEG